MPVVFPRRVAAFDDAWKPKVVPEHSSDQSEHPAELVLPLVEPGNEAKQKIGEQRSPYLPAHGVFVVAEEVRQLQRLLQFLECTSRTGPPPTARPWPSCPSWPSPPT